MRATLPTQLERDTLLIPKWVAQSVVQEAERFNQADLPADFIEQLEALRHRAFNGEH